MKKGSYRTPDGKAQIDWELRDREQGPVFSATGTYQGVCGQCLDSIAASYPEDEMVQRITAVWRDWHLNDMKAGTEHHDALGCGYGKSMPFIVAEANEVQKRAIELWILGSGLQKKRDAWLAENRTSKGYAKYAERTGQFLSAHHANHLRQYLARGVFAPGLVTQSDAAFRESVKAWEKWLQDRAEAKYPVVLEDRFYKDSLGFPCPVTGELYGHKWCYRPIPEDVLKEIESWPQTALAPLHEYQAETFLERHGIGFSFTGPDRKLWPAGGSSTNHPHFVIHLTKNGPDDQEAELTFDFWNSVGASGVTPFDAVGCIASDADCEEIFEDWCSGLGYDPDSRKAYATWQACLEFSRKIQNFFSEEELEELRGMQF